jgi:predicted transcriptional regulator
MASEHPKVTAYIPQEILKALDGWKQAHTIESSQRRDCNNPGGLFGSAAPSTTPRYGTEQPVN